MEAIVWEENGNQRRWGWRRNFCTWNTKEKKRKGSEKRKENWKKIEEKIKERKKKKAKVGREGMKKRWLINWSIDRLIDFNGMSKNLGLFYSSAQLAWRCRIGRLHICRGIRCLSSNICPGYDSKPSHGEAPHLDLWENMEYLFIAINSRSTLT